MLYTAEFIPRKNHKFIIQSLPYLIKLIPNIKIVFAGTGILLEGMKEYANSIGVAKYIDFLGFRSDVHKLAAIVDIGISSSKQEGLGLGLAEEMLCGIPVVASEDRGHKEMIIHNYNGYMFPQNDKESFVKYINLLYDDPALREKMGEAAFEKAQEFIVDKSIKSMAEIYRLYL